MESVSLSRARRRVSEIFVLQKAVGRSFDGAPQRISLTLPAVPSDYDDLLNHYTHKGYRVIACAAKYERKLSWMKVQKLTRAEAECDLEFVGFIIFENKLKPSTSSVISELNKAGIRNIMCTGDNILTAVSVARECQMLDPDEHCFIPHFVEGVFPCITTRLHMELTSNKAPSLDSKTSLSWESVEDPELRLDPRTLLVELSAPNHDIVHLG